MANRPKSSATKPTARSGGSKSAAASGSYVLGSDDLIDSDVAAADMDAADGPDPADGDVASSSAEERKPWPVRLYLGEIGIDFIGRRRRWYAISAGLVLISLISMIFSGFNLGVEFAGGERFRAAGTEQQLPAVSQSVEDLGAQVTSAQAVGDNQLVIITADLSEQDSARVTEGIAEVLGVDPTDVANSTTSASWGQDVTSKAIQGLLIFLVLVLIFLAVRFDPKMAIGAMVALFHDLVLTAGVYSLLGFEVTPASVIGFLTILGFSLYDTVVVFDKVDENAKGLLASQRRTYSESANLAINQVLMRSINTSIFALLPVLGLLYAGVFVIGEGTLQDLAVVLVVGLAAGVYSSIFLAAPVLCDLKEREPEYQKLAKRLTARRAATPAGDLTATTPAQQRAPRPRTRGSASTAVDAGPAPDVESEDRAELRSGAGPGTVVASARRSRPRSSRVAAGAAKSIVATPPATSGRPETDASSASAGTKESAGARLAPRPGAKPTGKSGTRTGSSKRRRT